jgi:hypothetical protein
VVERWDEVDMNRMFGFDGHGLRGEKVYRRGGKGEEGRQTVWDNTAYDTLEE